MLTRHRLHPLTLFAFIPPVLTRWAALNGNSIGHPRGWVRVNMVKTNKAGRYERKQVQAVEPWIAEGVREVIEATGRLSDFTLSDMPGETGIGGLPGGMARSLIWAEVLEW